MKIKNTQTVSQPFWQKFSNKVDVTKCKVKSKTIQNTIFLFSVHCNLQSCLALLIRVCSPCSIAELAVNEPSFGWIVILTHWALLWGLLTVSVGCIYNSSCNATKTPMPAKHLVVFFNISFFRWEGVVLAKNTQKLPYVICCLSFWPGSTTAILLPSLFTTLSIFNRTFRFSKRLTIRK